MKQNLLYKILSILLFLIITLFTIILYRELETVNIINKVYIGSLVFFTFLLSALLFWLASTKPIYIYIEKTHEKEKEDTALKADKKITDKKEEIAKKVTEKSKILLKDLDAENDINKLTEKILLNFAKAFSIVQGIAFIKDKDKYSKSSTYALYSNKEIKSFAIGEGITGQVARNKKLLNITEIPENYITVLSGLGNSNPSNLLIMPFVYNDETIAVIELASFTIFPDYIKELHKEISAIIVEKLNFMLK